jgi:Chaperone of endosialidase
MIHRNPSPRLLRRWVLSLCALGCFAFCPAAQAVVPAPDGGYPGFNTAEGTNALFSLTTGVWNTAIGGYALFSDTTGEANTALGTNALRHNTTGINNTATGVQALFNNTSGVYNTANGVQALFSNTDGVGNTAVGMQALFSNTTGDSNTATGDAALSSNTTGNTNTANGTFALQLNNTGVRNTAIGAFALQLNTTGERNTAIGLSALSVNTTGDGNIALGALAGTAVTTANNVIAIGDLGANVSNSCFIGNIRGVTTANANAIPVLIDSAGQLGTVSSSRRFKQEIKAMDSASEAIHALKPVTFHYKSDGTNTPQFGLIAEEVAEVNQDLVVRDENGEIYTVRYEAVNAMLLNEFLKEHHTVKEQGATIAELKKEIAVLAATVKEQATQIQKVSAHLEASKPAPQLVNNP